MASTILSDNGVTSGSAGLKTTAASDGALALQTTTAGGTATTALTIDTSQNVGIGTTSPDSSNKLQVTGDIGLTWATDKFIGMKFGAGTSYKMGLVLKDSTRECKVWSQSSDSDDKITFYTGPTPSERMRISSAGNVGIGVTAPAKPLSVYGGDGYVQMLNASTGTATGDGSFIGVEGGTTALRIVNQENDVISFSTNGLANERMRIDNLGNVLVGATTPYSGTASNFTATTGVDIGSSSTATSKQLQFIRSASTGTAGNIYATAGSFSNYCGIEFVIENVGGGSQAGYLKFNTTSSATSAERMRIRSDGALLVGTTVEPTNVYNGFKADASYTIIGASSATCLYVNRNTTTGEIVQIRYNNGGVGSISTNGSNTTYGTSSDYRLKENIAPMAGALATVAQLKPVTYKWKSTGEESQGFIAHELAEVVPECVVGEKDATEVVDIKDEEGNVIGQETKPKYQSIDTSFLVATLTAAIQELKAINDTQAETINALTARIVALEQA